MAVQLFKNGRYQVFDEYTFTDALAAGWSLSDEDIQVVVEAADPAQPEKTVGVGDPDIGAMTKKEFEIHARNFMDSNGKPIELDRRMNKSNMVKSFLEQKG